MQGDILRVCLNCTKGFHCDISNHACNISGSNSPSLIAFNLPQLHYFALSMGFIILFSYIHINCFDDIHHAITFCFSSPNGYHPPSLPGSSPFTFMSLFFGLHFTYERKHAVCFFFSPAYFS
jgi:hypothetical protein